LFYLSAGVMLAVVAPLRADAVEAPLRRTDAPLLALVALLGGVIGPVLMLYGLSQVSGVVGSLLLNLEAPATIVLAVAFFGEHMGRREAVGAAVVVVGAAFLAIEPASGTGAGTTRGVLALTGACIAWGVDNNLTQRLSLRDPIALVRFKALAAGSGNLLI